MKDHIEPPGLENLKVTYDFGLHKVNDHTIPYCLLDIKFSGKVVTPFPRIGHLVVNFYCGETYKNKFLNYSMSRAGSNRLYIAGLFTEGSLLIEQEGDCKGYAIRMHPVIGYYFLRIPMWEITNRQIEITGILNGSMCRDLRSAQRNERIDTLEHQILDEFLGHYLPEKKMYMNDPIYHAVNKIIQCNGIVKIKDLAREYCMSHRNFNRNFLLKVGISAQAYAKIWQMENAIKLIMQNPEASLTEIAFRAGYYDVSHLAHDFKEKTGALPTSFRRNDNSLIETYLTAESKNQ
ncbi:helix-turn-helix domain-containing protein [Gramella jeungdoensis]|uniref:Helix-turn-helix domain-containing protein n=1 Tax=Gramella jeungdoensis TaxID=708091 RepID=A0ABT0YZ96_9FLAO|nr:helix-turn-helix domain-containing protein [Gramella jeungdoensis]MCM8568787.1 helix-turn-helix domain-containing protein [Gramella jeungdoensis]